MIHFKIQLNLCGLCIASNSCLSFLICVPFLTHLFINQQLIPIKHPNKNIDVSDHNTALYLSVFFLL